MQKLSSLLGYDGYGFDGRVRHSGGLVLALPPADRGGIWKEHREHTIRNEVSVICRFHSFVQTLGAGSSSERHAGERLACPSPGTDSLGGRLSEAIKTQWYLSWGRHLRNLLFGFLPLLFLLASCSSGDDEEGSRLGSLSVKLALTPGNENVTVELVEKGAFVRLLNISTYQLTAIDSADETMRIEGDRLAESNFSGSTLTGLTNDRNYTFALQAFYFPTNSDPLSNLSLEIDYADDNARNIQAAGGITIGTNTDGDYLADLADADDDNDKVADDEDLGEYNGRQCRLFTDCDGDGLNDDKDLGEYEGRLCRIQPDCDNDTIPDGADSGEFRGTKCYLSTDCDRDSVADGEDLGEYDGRLCHLFADCDKDTLSDAEDLGEFNGTYCRAKPDCDDDRLADTEDNCPAIANVNQEDGDNDGAGDVCDLDADGNGLIEIGTAAELNAVRWVLDGSGRRFSESAALDRTGCDNGAAAVACNGYELARDISLAAYAGGKGWAPLGQDTDSGKSGCQGMPFNGTFDGKGFTVRDLNISRNREDCVGLFGHLAAGTVIRNLTVRAGTVIGDDNIGSMVGSGDGVKIVSSSSVAELVRGRDAVGGLVGYGQNAEIVSSYSVAGAVRGFRNTGGLVGHGVNAEVFSSYSVAGAVRGAETAGESTGGLIGLGRLARIISSSSVAGAVRGYSFVGGFIGDGERVKIVSSSSVAGEVRGNSPVGGLVSIAVVARITSSYSLAGEMESTARSPKLGGLIGDVPISSNAFPVIEASYWNTSMMIDGNDLGEGKSLAELRTPTNDNAYDAGSIYATWMSGADIAGGSGKEDITIFCDEDLSGAIEPAERRDGSGGRSDNRIWDFGGENDYPVIRCLPLNPAEQRSWWFINSTGHPNLNQTRLDALP